MFVGFVLLIIAGLLVAHYWRAGDFAREIAALKARVIAAGDDIRTIDLASLPPMVLAFAQRNGATVGAAPTVIAQQRAEMRLAPDQPFFPLSATQIFGTRQPGFVWHATGTMMGFVPVEIVDAYVDGEGLLEARIAVSITVAKAEGGAMDRGEAMRFLAELPFNPDAIVNAPQLQWRQIDARHVAVSMPVRDGAAEIIMTFDEAGDVSSIEAEGRPRMVGDAAVSTRWVGRYADYAQIGAYRLPRQGEVLWDLPEGEFVYWRGGMTGLVPSGS